MTDQNTPPENTPDGQKTQPQVAVWFFVAATFAFVSPTIWFKDAEGPLVTILSMTLGGILFAAGIVVLSREITRRRDADSGEHPSA